GGGGIVLDVSSCAPAEASCFSAGSLISRGTGVEKKGYQDRPSSTTYRRQPETPPARPPGAPFPPGRSGLPRRRRRPPRSVRLAGARAACFTATVHRARWAAPGEV